MWREKGRWRGGCALSAWVEEGRQQRAGPRNARDAGATGRRRRHIVRLAGTRGPGTPQWATGRAVIEGRHSAPRGRARKSPRFAPVPGRNRVGTDPRAKSARSPIDRREGGAPPHPSLPLGFSLSLSPHPTPWRRCLGAWGPCSDERRTGCSCGEGGDGGSGSKGVDWARIAAGPPTHAVAHWPSIQARRVEPEPARIRCGAL